MKHLVLVLTTAFMAFVMLLSAAPAVAQGNCEFCEDDPSGAAHRFGGSGAFFTCDGPGAVGCHSGWYTEQCTDHHYTCHPEDEELDQLAAAIDAADAAQINALLAPFKERVRIDPVAREITLRCAYGLAARIPIPEATAIAVLRDRSSEAQRTWHPTTS